MVLASTSTIINLCKVNFRPEHQLRWDSIEQQTNYFNSKVVSPHINTSYQDRRGVIKISGYVDNLITANYGYYENSYNGTKKRYYFWILEHNYMARDTTELKIQLDVIQTWYFNVSMDMCFVERMHTSVDNRYVNLLEDNLELGDYVVRKRVEISELKETCLLLFVSDQDGTGYRAGKTYNALKCYYFTLSDTAGLARTLKLYMDNGLGDAITYISIFPDYFIHQWFGNINTGDLIRASEMTYKQYEFTNDFLEISYSEGQHTSH